MNFNNSNLNNNNKDNNNYVRSFCEFWNELFMTQGNITLEECFEAYYECRKHKRGKKGAVDFESDYEANLVELCEEINERRYEISTSTCFIVTHPKKREVFAAAFRDRIVHHLIMHRLEPLLEQVFIEDNYNCRKGKGVLYGVNRLKEKMNVITANGKQEAWVLKCDIQGFFMAIHKPTLWRMLRDFVEERYHEDDKELLLYLVEKVVMHCPAKDCIRHSPIWMWDDIPDGKSLFKVGDDYGLPIGNLTSQAFANFHLHGMDAQLNKEFGGMYGRYVDDFYILSQDKSALLGTIPKIRTYLKEKLGLTLHPDKVYLQPVRHGVKFTGSVTDGRKIYIGNGTVNNMFNKIKRYNAIEDKETMINDFATVLNSYLGFLSHSQSYAIRRKAMQRIDKKWWQYMYFARNARKAVVKRRYKATNILTLNQQRYGTNNRKD